MEAKDIKINENYIYKNKIVIVIGIFITNKKIKRNIKSGKCFTGYKYERNKFILSDNKVVFAKELTEIIQLL